MSRPSRAQVLAVGLVVAAGAVTAFVAQAQVDSGQTGVRGLVWSLVAGTACAGIPHAYDGVGRWQRRRRATVRVRRILADPPSGHVES
ncbi:hypothetical protein OHV05_04460 [Kitasatospora sp. NBC_00070]|uniref:hypothetical protein n=1 Tax=Kitasatospora sp. NBC_00070 TaxID=2975962 RepID=UPI0032508BB3